MTINWNVLLVYKKEKKNESKRQWSNNIMLITVETHEKWVNVAYVSNFAAWTPLGISKRLLSVNEWQISMRYLSVN